MRRDATTRAHRRHPPESIHPHAPHAPHADRSPPPTPTPSRAVLDRNGVQVDRVEAADLPLVDARCSPFGWCLVEEGKDCRPTTWSWPTKPCEQLNATGEQRALYLNRFKPRSAIAGDMRKTVGVAMNEA